MACVYDPLEYAWKPFARYMTLYGQGPKDFVLLGMNPGPWGMAQTGVPFGEVAAVRDWMGLRGEVGQPARPHPKRPVLGLPQGAEGTVTACPIFDINGNFGVTFGSVTVNFDRLTYSALIFADGTKLWPPVGTRR